MFNTCKVKFWMKNLPGKYHKLQVHCGAKYLVFSPLIPSKREKNYISFAQIVHFFKGSVFNFHFLNDKIHNYVFL